MQTPDNFNGEQSGGLCWNCGEAVSAGDNYCKKCGKGQGSKVPWQYKHWGVIALTLLGLGPFSLFYIWRSPVISRKAKIAYTGAIFLLTWFVINSIYSLWNSVQAMLGGTELGGL